MIGISHIHCCYGNYVTTIIIPITPLSYVVFSPYLVRRFFGMTGISHIPHCYSNLVTMATTVIHQ